MDSHVTQRNLYHILQLFKRWSSQKTTNYLPTACDQNTSPSDTFRRQTPFCHYNIWLGQLSCDRQIDSKPARQIDRQTSRQTFLTLHAYTVYTSIGGKGRCHTSYDLRDYCTQARKNADERSTLHLKPMRKNT